MDASALLLLYVPEAGASWVRRLWSDFDQHLAPDLAFVEVSSALLKKVRRCELDGDEARAAIGLLAVRPPIRRVPTQHLLPAAYEFASTVHCSLYDAVYATLALHTSSRLLTADEAFARALGAAVGGPELILVPRV